MSTSKKEDKNHDDKKVIKESKPSKVGLFKPLNNKLITAEIIDGVVKLRIWRQFT